MLKKLSDPKKEDICPNCGTACFATDVLCLKCGKNLDELFEQLPDVEESYNMLKAISKHISFLTWLAPFLIIFSPFIVSLVTALPFTLRARALPDRSPLQLIWYVVPSSTLVSSDFLIISAVLLFVCTTRWVRTKVGHHLVVILAVLFSILSAINLWSGLAFANVMSVVRSFAYIGGLVQIYTPADWVYLVIAGGIILIALNLIVVIGQSKNA